MLRRLLIITLLFIVIFSPAGGESRAVAGEYDDAKVAFGAFADGLYDFAGAELTQFLKTYPNSKLAPRAHLVLTLCLLKTGDCQQAAQEFTSLKMPLSVEGFKVDPAELQLRLGNCFLAAGKKPQAVRFFTRVVKEDGFGDMALKARFRLSRIYFAGNNFAAADRQVLPLLKIADSKRIQSLKLNRQTIYWVAAFSSYRLQNYKKALPLLLKISRAADEFKLTMPERQDFYAIMIESAWHTGDRKLMTATIKRWLQIPAADLDFARLTSAVLLTAERLRSDQHLAEIRNELIRLTGFALTAAEKRTVYELLVEIAQADKDEKALQKWLEVLVALIPPPDAHRTAYLEILLQLNYRNGDYQATVKDGNLLMREQPQFWHKEKLYYPFLTALVRLDKCADIVKYVPAVLSVYESGGNGSRNQQRLALELMAGRCMVKLGRFADAVAFYRKSYARYSDPDIRIKLLVALCNLSGKLTDSKELDAWLSREVMENFSLDRREDEKRLRTAPALVLLVAEAQFASHLYIKALPSLLWLEKLDLKRHLRDRVLFLLAESYYRCGEPAEARARFELLYATGSREFHDLAALRLVTIYEDQGQVNAKNAAPEKLIKLYQDVLERETDPALKKELKHKLQVLQAPKK